MTMPFPFAVLFGFFLELAKAFLAMDCSNSLLKIFWSDGRLNDRDEGDERGDRDE